MPYPKPKSKPAFPSYKASQNRVGPRRCANHTNPVQPTKTWGKEDNIKHKNSSTNQAFQLLNGINQTMLGKKLSCGVGYSTTISLITATSTNKFDICGNQYNNWFEKHV
ncbi:hypothetical protein SESBI_22323 [Sesbania bispinosa]|nr:hypothetical protein SESBI_22323 [Sesbania bispinosa]